MLKCNIYIEWFLSEKNKGKNKLLFEKTKQKKPLCMPYERIVNYSTDLTTGSYQQSQNQVLQEEVYFLCNVLRSLII